VNRRELIAGLGGAVAWPIAAGAQQGERVRRIGVLMGQGKDDPGNASRVAAFEQTLDKLGWPHGQTVVAEFRWGAGNLDRMQSYARELIDLRPDVVVAESTPAASALRRESRTVPIVLSYISRRRMLSISAAAVGLVVVHRRASSQPAKRIEQYAPRSQRPADH
jgi:putative ABC transport system substrate-binding protein